MKKGFTLTTTLKYFGLGHGIWVIPYGHWV
ncbi:hypothetical protein QF042_004044 [Pedobacter sp. W3I1]|nr:hypothetical protein [Pedobacter sp. W3I1]